MANQEKKKFLFTNVNNATFIYAATYISTRAYVMTLHLVTQFIWNRYALEPEGYSIRYIQATFFFFSSLCMMLILSEETAKK